MPSTTSTSGIAAKAAGSVWAAQPVTISFASGVVAAEAADLLAGLAHRLGGDRAAVDDDGVAERRRASARPFIASLS